MAIGGLALLGACNCESALCLTVLRVQTPALDAGAWELTVSVDGAQHSCGFELPDGSADDSCFVDPVGDGFEVGVVLGTLVQTPGEVFWELRRDGEAYASGRGEADWTDPPKNNRCGNACIGGELEVGW